MAESNADHISLLIDRRTIVRSSLQLSIDGGDGNALAAAGISDGFRPTTDGSPRPSRITSLSSQRQKRSTPPPRPSSATKPRNLDNFGLKHDRVMMEALPTEVATVSTSSAPSITRSSSSSTDIPFVRAESPYQGPAGPSHPYHMYTQNTRLARTASVATSSTIPAPSERSYNGPSGPTHPYRMYPQNIVAEAEGLHDDGAIPNIPVGFPGHGGAYQRRLGPDGEEAGDIIGPLGHTEQLPPYTRYPENAVARKATPMMPHLPGAGGIGLATRDPEFASREDLSSPYRHSMASDSGHQINTAAIAASEKPPDKNWKTVAERRLFRVIPIWVFVLVGAIFLVLIVVLGAVLVIISHRRNSNSSNSQSSGADTSTGTVYATITTSYDASPVTTVPAGMPPLPTGTFMLPIESPYYQQQSCLDKNILDVAWSCDLPPGSIEMTVAPLVNSVNNKYGNRVTISANGPSPALFYGSQPPTIDPSAILSLVNDVEQTYLGPAWYFEAVYDKLVILPESDLFFAENTKRGEERNYREWNSKAVAQDGEKPWFCYWGGTIFEIFIYVDPPSDSRTGPASPIPTPSTYAQSTATAISPTPTGATSVGSNSGLLLESYPNIVKVEERRNPANSSSRAPYCVQMFILSNGTAVRLMNEDGKPNLIYPNETEPALAFSGTKRGEPDMVNLPAALELMGRSDTSTQHACRCEWLTQKPV